MRCTECNKEIKPVVAVDIDGTIGMYHKHFLEFAADYIGAGAINFGYDGRSAFKSWFCNAYSCPEDTWHDIKLAYRQGGMKRTMPPYPYASEMMTNVGRLGVEVWLTTTRPYIRHDNVDPDTREFLRRHKIAYDYLIYDGHKYEKLAKLVGPERVAAVLEDLPEEVGTALGLFGTGVVIHRRTGFNSAYQTPDSVNNLIEAERAIAGRLDLWKEQYEDRVQEGRHASHHSAGKRV